MQAQDRANLMLEFLQKKSISLSFLDCLAYIDMPLITLDWNMLIKTQSWKNLIKELREESKEECYIGDNNLKNELTALALLLPHTLAEKTLQSVVAIGLQRTDPALESLKLNMQLPPANQESQG